MVTEKLRQARIERGWTAAELADRAGVSRSTVAMLEAGLSDGRWATIVALARALDVRLDDLVAADSEPAA